MVRPMSQDTFALLVKRKPLDVARNDDGVRAKDAREVSRKLVEMQAVERVDETVLKIRELWLLRV